MFTKQLVNQLYNQMIIDLDITMEQLELIVQLYQSFETDEERSMRLSKFHQIIAKIRQKQI